MKKILLPVGIFLVLSSGTSSAQEAPVSGVDWDEVATCRSGGNWQHPPVEMNQSSFLYSGGLMIPDVSWKSYGGAEFAEFPEKASRTEQILVAERIVADEASGGAEFARTLEHCDRRD